MTRFKWDSSKASTNLRKHRVSFEEAQSVFFDDFAVQFFDDEHSASEDRFLMLSLSLSCSARLLMVCRCERGPTQTTRIISARKATPRESAFYQDGKP